MPQDDSNAVFNQVVGDYRVIVSDDKRGGVQIRVTDSELLADFLNLKLPSPGKFVADAAPAQVRPVSFTHLDVILNVVSSHFHVGRKQLLGVTRTLRVSEARHTAIWLARQLTQHSILELGTYFGKRDHSSILYAEKKIGERLKTDADFAKIVGFIRDKIRKGETGDKQHETGEEESGGTGQ